MKWTIRPTSNAVILGAVLVIAAGGCTELILPWADDLPRTRDVTTASVEGVRAANVAPAERTRQMDRAPVCVEDGTVVHWPLWWEDPFVDKGSEDGQFAWTREDYLAMPYGLGRFLLNTMAWPVSAAVTPAHTVMGSDGVLSRQALGYDHDAERRPGGVAPPCDILEVGTIAESQWSAEDVAEPLPDDADAPHAVE